MVVTATWCTTNVLNLFWITIGASKNSIFTASVQPFAGLESTQGSYYTD
jgi:hypothetical protein